MSLDNVTLQKHCSFGPRTLDTIERGSRCVVTSVSSSNATLRNKLLAMGIVAGTTVELAAVAPLGDPVTIKALGYSLSLRIAEAKEVLVMPVSNVSLQQAAA